MSADNWRICPQCKSTAEAERAEKIEATARKYGQIPSAEWMAMNTEANKEIEFKETLREDYEIWTSESGEFFVSYRCQCQTCGFEHTFRHKEMVGKTNKKRGRT